MLSRIGNKLGLVKQAKVHSAIPPPKILFRLLEF